jgi:hypothetical protein
MRNFQVHTSLTVDPVCVGCAVVTHKCRGSYADTGAGIICNALFTLHQQNASHHLESHVLLLLSLLFFPSHLSPETHVLENHLRRYATRRTSLASCYGGSKAAAMCQVRCVPPVEDDEIIGAELDGALRGALHGGRHFPTHNVAQRVPPARAAAPTTISMQQLVTCALLYWQ